MAFIVWTATHDAPQLFHGFQSRSSLAQLGPRCLVERQHTSATLEFQTCRQNSVAPHHIQRPFFL
ncbi:uncharacterized protein LACBIDRAFT_318276 [Laccaria bicolor S238N-H82]|uniref:Predicted protein n=1 Tax=Laccaria bicolor (strain S238N-H82 / ATCC MYA-4686) TaxID=486041 RepID=B0D6D0_LACBS|nr:uncharacterized protein LACBIDRAFT_318276 [Laccaria bicolor S238N-H82]EDR09928.1 predicted protein [Laccaria bicolor S238N-H82]|eukprot:XP_001879313.1 predicted protein [Laccaria bicolor S238N-H82]